VLGRWNGQAVERRNLAEQDVAGESEPSERPGPASSPVSDSLPCSTPIAGSPDSLLKSFRTAAISY
jgi:hypothetical protein